MALQAILNEPFTFQVLFVDDLNNPVAVLSPVIDIFSFSATGVKQPLVSSQAMVVVTPIEVGRYTYTYTIPTSLDDGDALYAEMSGQDLVSGVTLLIEQEIVVISSNRGLAGGSIGLSSNFVKGG